MKTPEFVHKKDLFDWLVKNKQSIFTQKKDVIKHADSVSFISLPSIGVGIAKEETSDDGVLTANVIMNTTKIIDSHMDMHLDGLWNRSLKANRYIIHNQEHGHGFKDIIAEGEDVKAFAKTYTWNELGFDYEGKTQALEFESKIKPDVNPYMYKKYKENKVRNHSVEMQYVKLTMAINDPDYKEEFSEWEKWVDHVANKEILDSIDYFFPIYEAKMLGGAAVPRGSNHATPTLSIKDSPDGTLENLDSSKDTLTVKEFKTLIKNSLK